MRILLVMPTPFENGRLGLENVVWLSEPVALTSVAAAVSQEHEVRVLDMRLEPEDAWTYLKDEVERTYPVGILKSRTAVPVA